MFKVKSFIQAYVVCALECSRGPSEEPHTCENLNDLFDTDDISPECKASMRADCLDFIRANFEDLQNYCKRVELGEEFAGQDFWLTRNGHGSGFWDQGLGALGERLSVAADAYNSLDLYPGDDGQIHGG